MKTFSGLPQVARFLRLLGPEPWTGFAQWREGDTPDDPACHHGRACDCEEGTFRAVAQKRLDGLTLTPIQWIRIEARQVAGYRRILCPDGALAAMAQVILDPDALDAQHDRRVTG